MRRSTVVVSEHHLVVIGIRTYDSYLPDLRRLDRKEVVLVLEENDRLTCNLEGMVLMFL